MFSISNLLVNCTTYKLSHTLGDKIRSCKIYNAAHTLFYLSIRTCQYALYRNVYMCLDSFLSLRVSLIELLTDSIALIENVIDNNQILPTTVSDMFEHIFIIST